MQRLQGSNDKLLQYYPIACPFKAWVPSSSLGRLNKNSLQYKEIADPHGSAFPFLGATVNLS